MPGEKTCRDDSAKEEASLDEARKNADNDRAGSMTHNRTLEREGQIEKGEDRARQAQSDIVEEIDEDADGDVVR